MVHEHLEYDSDGNQIAVERYHVTLAAAQSYSEKGWALVPLWGIEDKRCTCGDPECTSPGKHPCVRKWVNHASPRIENIRRWLNNWPNINLGVVTGSASGFFVVDVDGAEGEASFSRLLQLHGGLPDTLTAQTGRGRHLYFRYPGQRVKSTAGIVAEGVDVRGDGAYIIAPPSLHVSGAQYKWVCPEAEIVEAPSWLIQLVCENAPLAGVSSASEIDGVVSQGARNQTLFKRGCGMRGGGASQEEIEEALLDMNAQECQPPLQNAEVTRIARSAASYPAGFTRNVGLITGDSNRLPWLPWHTTAFRRNQHVMLMADYQLGWYVWLIVESWERGGYLPNDAKLLARFAKAANPKRFCNEMHMVLAEFDVTADETLLVHEGLRAEYEARAQKVNKKREAALKRWALRDNELSSRSPNDEAEK